MEMWTPETMIAAIEEAIEREKASEDNSGIVAMSFQIAEMVLIPMLKDLDQEKEYTIKRD